MCLLKLDVQIRPVFADPVTFIDQAIQINVGQKDKENQWRVGIPALHNNTTGVVSERKPPLQHSR